MVDSTDFAHGDDSLKLDVIPDSTQGPLASMRYEVRNWLDAVNLQERRVVDTTAMDRRMIDARLFAIALRLLYRACVGVHKLTGDAEMAKALHLFEGAVPSVVHIRDVTEHFDAYIQCEGRLGAGVRLPAHSYTSGSSTHLIHVPEFSDDGELVNMYYLDMAVAAHAARGLANAVL